MRCLFAFIVGFTMLHGSSAAIRAQAEKLDWVRVTEHAAWQPRDSQGELVYNDKLWIFGGWFDSYQSPLRDVWNSSDGVVWNRVQQTAPWKHSDLPMTVVFNDKMWFMGGWHNGRLPDRSASNEVWWSTDGATWTQATTGAAWTPRAAAGIVEFRGKMWVLGGTEEYLGGQAERLKNDVWSSVDGVNWNLETANAGWAPRAFHQAVVLNDKIYVMGGGNYDPTYKAFNDVWSSIDGIHWQQETANAPWSDRLWFSSVVHRDQMWVLGGWSNNPSQNWGDVWRSQDGKNWTRLESDVIWQPRHEPSAYVFKDKVWVAGGMIYPLVNDVWSLNVPESNAVKVDKTTRGNWVLGNTGDRVYGNSGYILPSAKALIKQQYSAIGNNDGSLTDLVSLPSWVSRYSYNDPGIEFGWYGEDPNNNPVNALAALEDPTDQSIKRQVGANLYVDASTQKVPTITLYLTGEVPPTFQIGIYGSPLGRTFSQHAGSTVYSVNGESVTYSNSDPDFQAGVWTVFTVNNATAGPLEIAVTPISSNGTYPANSYAFISAITFDVEQASAGLSGDYNNDGSVDAADYVLWRKGGPLQNDATPGVQPEDYEVWKANLGKTSPEGNGSGTSLNAPEPNVASLVGTALSLVIMLARSH